MMTLIVNKYYKRISQNIDNFKMKFDISALLVKSKEVDVKIDDINENLKDNSELINTNKENISKNNNEIYKKGLLTISNQNNIIDIEEGISVNSTEIIYIKSNITDIENSLKQIPLTLKDDITNIEEDIKNINLKIVDLPNMKTSLNNVKYRQAVINIHINRLTPLQDTVKNNSTNITNNYNIGQINKKKTEFNTDLIDNHRNNIISINSTLTDIKNDIEAINSNTYTPVSNSKYSIENIFLFDITYIKDLTFLSDTEELLVYQNIIKDDFKKDSIIEINKSFLYKYNKIKNVYYILKEQFEFLNENDNIIY